MKRSAFTLIELLIVVAIIAILAAIAVPNFLEAQTRAKVSRVLTDMRSLATGLEAYAVDNNDYVPAWQQYSPLPHDQGNVGDPSMVSFNQDKFVQWRLVALTTPVEFFSFLPETPFLAEEYWHSGGSIDIPENLGFEYDRERISFYNNEMVRLSGAVDGVTKWHLRDCGPDHSFNNRDQYNTPGAGGMPYDPTNGTASLGDIWRFGP
jgi:general secretion pathway protein G